MLGDGCEGCLRPPLPRSSSRSTTTSPRDPRTVPIPVAPSQPWEPRRSLPWTSAQPGPGRSVLHVSGGGRGLALNRHLLNTNAPQGPGGPALRLQQCLRVTALPEGGEKTPSPEKTRPALRQQGRTVDTASLTEGQAALQHRGPRPPRSQGAGGPTCLAGGQAPAQRTSPGVPAPAWEGTARGGGVVGSAPRPFLCSASATFSCSHFSKTPEIQGRRRRACAPAPGSLPVWAASTPTGPGQPLNLPELSGSRRSAVTSFSSG